MRAILDSDGLCFRRKGRAWRLKVMRDWGSSEKCEQLQALTQEVRVQRD